MRVLGFPQYEPIASARSKSGSVRTWSSSARGAGPTASRRSLSRRSSSPGSHGPETIAPFPQPFPRPVAKPPPPDAMTPTRGAVLRHESTLGNTPRHTLQ